MTIPGINEVRTGRRTSGQGDLARTIEDRANKNSGKSSLLPEVQIVRDLWSIGILGERLGHGLNVYSGGRILAEGGAEGKEGVLERRRDSGLYGGEGHAGYKNLGEFI